MKETKKGKSYLDTNSIIEQTRNGTYSNLLTNIKNGYIEGATHLKNNSTAWFVPKDVAEDYIYIIDHQDEIREAILFRAKQVSKKYDVSNSQICKSVGIDSGLLYKYSTDKNVTVTYKMVYKLCKKSAGLRCKISTIVKIAKDNSIGEMSTDFTCTTNTLEQQVIKLERIIKEQKDNLDWLRSEIDRLKFISKVSKRKLRKYNKLNKGE